ncbi:hypothetical protein HDV05_006857 [Chytridiales sp. JEL 0842]|nr:hypothetical protein HDV05_006857 [Chytridiales sp. JEL 0842]
MSNNKEKSLSQQASSSTLPAASILPFLESSNIWPGLDSESLNAIAAQMTLLTFKQNDVLFEEGDLTSHLYVIVEGSAVVYKRVHPGLDLKAEGKSWMDDSVKLITLHVGEYIGESTLLEGTPLTATIVAASSPTQVLALSTDSFKALLESHPSISKSLLRGLARELRSFRSAMARSVATSTGSHSLPAPLNALPSTESLDSTAALLPPPPPVRVIRMAVFDFMKHEKESFETGVKNFADSLDPKTDKFEVTYLEYKLNRQTARLAAGCQIVSIFVNDDCTAEVLTLLANQGVQLVCLRCAGFNNVDLKAASALGITVTRVPAYSPYAVAEFAAGLAMSLNRKIVQASGRVRQGNFSLAGLVGFDFHGKTVGVVGTGKIGQCFIKIMLGFGCKVLCFDAYPSKEVASWEGCTYVDLDTLLSSSRIISLHCPLLPETKHMINADSLAKMPKGVVLINTSRGGLINTADLIAALKSSHVAAAGLDVYEYESSLFFEDHSGSILEDDNFARLQTFNNVIVTGHQAFLTEEALNRIAEVTMMENVKGFMVEGKRGKELINVV